MKQVKIAFEKCKKKLPNRPPDEIDFGLGFRAGLNWTKEEIVECLSPQDALELIEEELE